VLGLIQINLSRYGEGVCGYDLVKKERRKTDSESEVPGNIFLLSFIIIFKYIHNDVGRRPIY